ncbi:MAG: hypothetical protein QOK49_54 [Baekduia sp.]|nr:hypothetical protein [Baekduia sp.]
MGALVAGIAAGDAHAACGPQTVRQRDDRAPLILTGVIESGPQTPARLRVESWQKGTGPGAVDLDTGVYADYAFGEGIYPHPGERWRIFGQWHDGMVVTGTCFGSRLITAPPSGPPTLSAGSATAQAVPAGYGGRPLAGALPTLRVAPGRPRELRVPSEVGDLRLVGARGGAKLTRKKGRWTLHVPAGDRPGGGRLVADTGDAFYAVRLG